jgi:hypothetical protein
MGGVTCDAGHIRISYVRSMEVLKEGLDRIEKYIGSLGNSDGEVTAAAPDGAKMHWCVADARVVWLMHVVHSAVLECANEHNSCTYQSLVKLLCTYRRTHGTVDSMQAHSVANLHNRHNRSQPSPTVANHRQPSQPSPTVANHRHPSQPSPTGQPSPTIANRHNRRQPCRRVWS